MEENKFNFSEEENIQSKEIEQDKEAVKEDAKDLFVSLKQFMFGFWIFVWTQIVMLQLKLLN